MQSQVLLILSLTQLYIDQKKTTSLRLARREEKKKIRGRPRESGLLKSEEKKTSNVKRSSLGLGDGLGDLVSLSCLYFVQFRDPQSSKKRTELQAPYSETSRRRMQDQHTREPSFQQKHSVSVRVHRPGA